MRSGSTFFIPSITLVQIKGNIVSIAMKTGTEPGLSQIRAKRISAIIGVERMTTRIGFRKALKLGLIPAITPKPTPKMADIINPRIPRNTVEPTTDKKLMSPNRFIVVRKVFSGEGRIKSESNFMDNSFQMTSIKPTVAKLIYCLVVNECFIRDLSSNNIGVHIVKHSKVLLYLLPDFICTNKIKISFRNSTKGNFVIGQDIIFYY